MIYKKILLIIFVSLSVLFLSASLLCEYIPAGIIKIKFLSGHRDFIVSILTGLFGSTLLSSLVTGLEVIFDRDRILYELLSDLYSLRRELNSLEEKIFPDIDTEYKYSVELNRKILLLDRINKRCNDVLENTENAYLSKKYIPENEIRSLLCSLDKWSDDWGIRGNAILGNVKRMSVFLKEFYDYLQSKENRKVKAELDTIIGQLEKTLKI